MTAPLTDQQREYIRGVWYGRIGQQWHATPDQKRTAYHAGLLDGSRWTAQRWTDDALRIRARRLFPSPSPITTEAV